MNTMIIPVVGEFEKVSYREFSEAMYLKNENDIKDIYDNLIKPKRATEMSAGYDFFAPYDIILKPGCSVTVPTGFRVRIKDPWFLAMYPRSGLGFKYKVRLANTVGVIDGDYYYSDNEGHIMLKLCNESTDNKLCTVRSGDGMCQGIFQMYGITSDDNASGKRNGGFGSTDRQ